MRVLRRRASLRAPRRASLLAPRRASLLAALLVPALVGCGGDDEVPGSDDGQADAAPAPDAPPAPPMGDGLPQNAVLFFRAGACPDGWAVYGDAAHRTLVPSPDDVGVDVGFPLADGAAVEAHGHDGTVGVDLASVNYAGAAGGGNSGVAASGAHGASALVATGSESLPYLQLLVCRKVGGVNPQLPPPAGMHAFFAIAACPAGWTAADGERRLIVGLPAGGTAGATFGGPPLASGELRKHAHAITGMLTTSSHGIALASGGAAGGYARNDSYAVTGSTDEEASRMPYLQLRLCKKE